MYKDREGLSVQVSDVMEFIFQKRHSVACRGWSVKGPQWKQDGNQRSSSKPREHGDLSASGGVVIDRPVT